MRILFVCTGNTCRSPMAEVLARSQLKALGREDVTVSSAGAAAMEGDGATAGAREAMASRGLSLEDHRSRGLTVEMLEEADTVIFMTRAARDRVASIVPQYDERCVTLSRWAGAEGDVADPYGGGAAVYEQTARQLEQWIAAGIARHLA